MFSRFVILILCFISISASAQTKPIRMIVPFGVGGLVDTLNRTFADSLENETGLKFIIESKPGAGGAIGLRTIAQSNTDEILLSIIDVMVISNNTLLNNDIRLNDFNFVAQLGTTSSVGLVVKKGSNINTLEKWREHKGNNINVGINGYGGAHHFYNWNLRSQLTNTPIREIAYKGIGDMLRDLLGGHIDAIWSSLSSIQSQIASGNIEVVAVVQQNNAENYPTFRSQGITMPQNAKWIVVANNTKDRQSLEKIVVTVKKLLNQEDFQSKIRQIGLILEPNLVDQVRITVNNSIEQQTKFIDYYKTTLKNN
jgi:tripartite-type tricarboxylate transporter receptor subunit TctC